MLPIIIAKKKKIANIKLHSNSIRKIWTHVDKIIITIEWLEQQLLIKYGRIA